MNSEIDNAIAALEGLASVIEGMWTDTPFHIQISAWNTPPISRVDLSSIVRELIEKLRKCDVNNEISPELRRKIINIPMQISWFQNQTLPQLPGGNLPVVVEILFMIINNVEMSLPAVEQLANWEEVEKSNLIPRNLAARIRAIESALTKLEPRAELIEGQVDAINSAHQAASDLPTDLQSLREARLEIETIKKGVAVNYELSNKYAEHIKSISIAVNDKNLEIHESAKNIIDILAASTSHSLSNSFQRRADNLTKTTWAWVFILFIALASGFYIGHSQWAILQGLLLGSRQSQTLIWLSIIISILSFGGPVWFSWIATRQIAQRFRLAEDYAFKAAVAQAYEGYRRQAERIDPALEKRLFGSALDRLEEVPGSVRQVLQIPLMGLVMA